MNKIVLAVMLFVSLLKSEEINIWNKISDQYSSSKKKEDISSELSQSSSTPSSEYTSSKKKEDISSEPSQSNSIPSRDYTSSKTKQDISSELSQSNSIVSNTPQCTYFTVSYEVKQLNIRDKPGKPSNVVGKLNTNESVCIYDLTGKWGRTDRGWVSMKYLSKNIEKNNFLLADIDNDGKKERLQWEYLELEDAPEFLLQLKLLDDDGSLLWEGPRKFKDDKMHFTSVFQYLTPAVLDDIDGDGNIELVIGSSPHEPISSGYSTYIWDGKKFIKTTKSKFYRDLVWVDAPNGKTLKWTLLEDKDYRKKKKIWWTHGLQQMNNNNELHLVNISGVQYPDATSGSRVKAKIRFTPTGAVIEELIK